MWTDRSPSPRPIRPSRLAALAARHSVMRRSSQAPTADYIASPDVEQSFYVAPLPEAAMVLGLGANYTVTGSPGSQIVNVISGNITLNADLSTSLTNIGLQVAAGATVAIDSSQ